MKPDALPSPLAQESFRVGAGLEHVPYSRLRRVDFVALAHGLRVHRSRADLQRARLAAPLLGANQFFSHTTAAEVWGMPVPFDAALHTTTIGAGSVTRRPGFVGHRVSPEGVSVEVVRGIRVSPRLQTWGECATVLTQEELIIVGDYLVGPRCGHSLDELEAEVARRRGQRGARGLRRALASVCVGAESPRETRLRLQLLDAGFRLPLLNCSIHDGPGRFIARPDIIYGRERVCVEYDGDHHRTDRKTYRDDKRRREALADAGWRVLYLSDDDLSGRNWEAFVVRLGRALARGESDYLARRAMRHS